MPRCPAAKHIFSYLVSANVANCHYIRRKVFSLRECFETLLAETEDKLSQVRSIQKYSHPDNIMFAIFMFLEFDVKYRLLLLLPGTFFSYNTLRRYVVLLFLAIRQNKVNIILQIIRDVLSFYRCCVVLLSIFVLTNIIGTLANNFSVYLFPCM
jgi:hypothetical protein